jgi:hypothetical protein
MVLATNALCHKSTAAFPFTATSPVKPQSQRLDRNRAQILIPSFTFKANNPPQENRVIRTPWHRLAYFGFQSLLQRLAGRRQGRRAMRTRLRRLNDFTLGPVAAEICEPRQMLSAAITAVSPNSAASGSSGTTVNIMGSGFQNVMGVEFGSTPAASFQVLSSSAISAVAPAEAAGTVDIIIQSMSGSSQPTPADQFSFTASPPTVTGVGPSSGSTAGGQTISITGTNLTNVTAVLFGGTNAGSFMAQGTSIMVMAPAHAAGTVDVTVVTSAGTSAVDPLHDQYTYGSTAATVSSVSPSMGAPTGGTSVTIQGTGFSGVTGVTFGGTTAASFVVNSSTSITAVSPAHMSGSVDVQVVTAGGTSAAGPSDQFVYTAPISPPVISGLTTTSGPTAGNTSVTISGSNFQNVTAVYFGSQQATAVTPPEAAATVAVTVVNSAGTSSLTPADQYTFTSPAPTVASLSAATGSIAGGTSVTITGTNFMGASAVYFGGVAVSFQLNSPTSITAISPAGTAGTTADVTVKTPNGTSALSTADRFTFVVPPPQVTGLSASSGSSAGGNTITITGSNFTNATQVSFGTATANFTVLSDTSISVVTPQQGTGIVDVQVTTPAGTSAPNSTDQYTFLAATNLPSISGLDRRSGSTAGGTTVTISGINLAGATAVDFGNLPAQSFTVNAAAATITAVAPAQVAGTVDVTVITPAGPTAAGVADQFTYTVPESPPAITALSSSTGGTSGGDIVTITGVNFATTQSVSFGGTAATLFLVQSATQILAVAPAFAAGTVDVTVTNDGGKSPLSAADQFTFQPDPDTSAGSDTGDTPAAPTITGLDQTLGSTVGGESVTIRGDNLANVNGVFFGATPAISYSLNFDGSLTAVAPAETAGAVDVTVQTPDGTSALTTADQFIYDVPPPPPTVTGLSASSGGIGGGASVVISGTNFRELTGVSFGGVAAQSYSINADGTISAIAPAEPEGTVDVTVANTRGTSPASAADLFTFRGDVPVVTGLSAVSGYSSGGDSITIYGMHLAAATAVFFGGVSATFMVNDDGTLSAVTPAQAAGAGDDPADVTVVTAAGVSALQPSDQFSYTPAGSLPSVAGLSSAVGSETGGGEIIITGANFTDVSGVSFGGVAASSFYVVSPTSIVAVAPAAAAPGTADVVVATAAGLSQTGASDQYTFYDPAVGPPAASNDDSSDGSSSSSSSSQGGDGGSGSGGTGAGGAGSTGGSTGGTNPAGMTSSNSYVVNQDWESSLLGASGQQSLFGSSLFDGPGLGAMVFFGFAQEITLGNPSASTIPILLVNQPVITGWMGGSSMTDGGTKTNSIVTSVTNADGSVFTQNDVTTITFSLSDVSTYTMPTQQQMIGPSTTRIVETIHEDWSELDTLTMPDGTGYVDSFRGSTDFGWNSSTYSNAGSSSSNYQETSSGQGNFGTLQNGISAPMMNDHLVFTDSGSAVWSQTASGTTSNGTTSQQNSSLDLRSDSYVHQSTTPTQSGDPTHVGPYQDGADVLTVTGLDNVTKLSSLSSTTDPNGVLLAYSSSSSKIGGGADNYTEDDHLDAETITPAGTNQGDPPGPLTHIEHDDTQTVGNDGYSINEGQSGSLQSGGQVANVDSRNDRDWGKSEGITNNTGSDDINTSDAAGDSTVAHDDFTFFDDNPENYTDSDVESESLSPTGSGGVGGTDDFKTTDDGTDQFTDSDTSKDTVTSVDPTGVVTKVTFNDKDGDVGNDGEHDSFEDVETIPTITTPEADHDTFSEKANVQDKYTEKGRIDISVDSPESALSDQLHQTESLILSDTSTASDDESDTGTEDIAGVPPSGGPTATGSDTEKDTFKDTGNVTDNLNLFDTLHSTERVMAGDGTVTETDIDLGDQDNLQDKEKDTLVDKHTNNSGVAGHPLEDDVTFDDGETDTEHDTGSDGVTVSTFGPVANGTLFNWSSIADLFDETDTDTVDDNGEDITDAEDDGPTETDAVPLTNDHETDTDGFTDNIDGKSAVMSGNNETTTDPVTGVKTTIGSSDLLMDTFDDEEIDNTVEQGPDIAIAGEPLDIQAKDYAQTSDQLQNADNLGISIVGNPSAGTTENISASISEGGMSDVWATDDDQVHENLAPGGIDDETDKETGGTVGNETIKTTGNSTITTIDPATGLKTVDTEVDGGKIILGEDAPDTSMDVHIANDPNHPLPAGSTAEDDVTSNPQDEETLDGQESSTSTIVVTGTTSDGTTVNSTEVLGSKLTADADTDDNETITGVESETNGNVTSATSRNTDKQSGDVQMSDTETTNAHDEVTFVDPMSGLKTTTTVDNNGSTDKISGDEASDATDVNNSSQSFDTDGDPETATTTDVVAGENDVTTDEEISDHLVVKVRTQGTDSGGDQVNLQETSTLDDSGTDAETDDDTQATDGSNSELAHDHSNGQSELSNFIKGSFATIDPTTGVKTTNYYNDFISSDGNDSEDANETETTAPDGTGTDTPTTSDDGSDTVKWNIQTVVTQTNPDGSPVAPATNSASSGDDTEAIVNGVVRDEGSISAVPGTPGVGASAPTVDGIVTAGDTSAKADIAGGDVVRITGTGFTSDSQVSFGGIAAQSSIVVSPTEIIAVAPVHAAGNVNVSVTNAAGASPSSDQFTFMPYDGNADIDDGGNGPPSPPAAGPSAQTAGAGIPAAVRQAFDIIYGEHGQKLLKAYEDGGNTVEMVNWLFWGWFGRKSDVDWTSGGKLQIEIQKDVDPVTAATLLMEHLVGDALGSLTQQLLDLNNVAENGVSSAAFDSNWDLAIAAYKAAYIDGVKFAALMADMYARGLAGATLGGSFDLVVYDTFKGQYVSAALGVVGILVVAKLAKGGAAGGDAEALALKFGNETITVSRAAADGFQTLSAAERQVVMKQLNSAATAGEARAILDTLAAKAPKAYDIVPYGQKAPGFENHHGVLDVWATKNIPGYTSRAADNPSIRLLPAQHEKTKEVFRNWLNSKTGKPVGVYLDWTSVSSDEIKALAKAMMDAAGVPEAVQNAYINEFIKYIGTTF